MASRTLGAPSDVLPTEDADREDALNALAVSLFNQMRAGGAPITMEEARAMASDQAGTRQAPAPVSDNPAAAIVSGSAAAEINPALRERAAPSPPTADQLRRQSYNAHRSRVARLAQQAGVSADEAESMLLRGYDEQGIRIAPNGRGGLLLEGPGGAPTAVELGEAMSDLTNLATDRRIADENARKEAWRSQAMLAGPNAARNAVNLFNTLPDEWKNVVAAGRLTPNLNQTGVTPLARDAAMASGDDRIRALQMQIAAEDARAQRQMQQQMMQFQATQAGADADRDLRAQQFEAEQAARIAAMQQSASQVAARIAADLQLSRDNTQARREDAAEERAARRYVADRQYQTPDQQLATARLAQQQTQQSALLAGNDPALRDIMMGNYQTGSASKYLANLAGQSDLSGTFKGFGPEDAQRFDAELAAIAERAALMGIPNHPFNNPEERAKVVQRYGLNTPWRGGRAHGWVAGAGVEARRALGLE